VQAASPAVSPRQVSAPASPVPAAVNTTATTASPLPTPPVSPVRTPVAAQAALPPTPPREVQEEVPAAVEEEEEEEEELSLGDLDNEVNLFFFLFHMTTFFLQHIVVQVDHFA